MLLLILLVLIHVMPAVARADAKAGEKKAQTCLLCHKPNNPAASVPTLEGQTREYLYAQTKAYKEKRRADPVMQTNVATLSDRDMRDIADYFASRKPVPGSFSLDAGKVARGRSRAEELKCASCHMPDFSGKREVPRLAGLDPKYIGPQIVAFTAGKRPHPPIGGPSDISAEDAESLAQYFAQVE
jgi:cytochrome c553